MRKLIEYIDEGRRKKVVDPNEEGIEQISMNGKTVTVQTPDITPGEDANDNGSNGLWAVDPPYDDDFIKENPLPKDALTKNMKFLLKRFKSESDFFVQGEAGWAKTSLIVDMARRFGRHVITVYLDKAYKEDLDGIPVPMDNGRGGVRQVLAMPQWAAEMAMNPDKKYLLFFDEMNQADPGVMNALMPIVLRHVISGVKFKNFFVGAAGNLESENEGGVYELSGPLKSRFGGVYLWKTGSKDDWKAAFDYLHKKWDASLSKEFVNTFEKQHDLFMNPRDLDKHVFNKFDKIRAQGDFDMFDAEDWSDEIMMVVKESVKDVPSEVTKVEELGQYVYDWMNQTEDNMEAMDSMFNDSDSMLSKKEIQELTRCIEQGFMMKWHPGLKMNVKTALVEDDAVGTIMGDEKTSKSWTAEQINRLLRQLKAQGVKFKYKSYDDVPKGQGFWNDETEEEIK